MLLIFYDSITKTKQRALSPIVATILLVVVSVVLVTIVLNWGRGFTNSNLDETNPILKQTTKNYLIGSPKLNAQGILTFKNISPGDKSLTITGYQIISGSEDENFNTTIDLNKTIISAGSTHAIALPAFPSEQKVTILLITDKNEYISVGQIQNIPEDLWAIPGPESELEPLSVAIYSPNNNSTINTCNPTNGFNTTQCEDYLVNSTLTFNATKTGGTGEYTCSWTLAKYASCNTLYKSTETITDCNFNKQFIDECYGYYVTLNVSSPGVEDINDIISFYIRPSASNCGVCPF